MQILIPNLTSAYTSQLNEVTITDPIITGNIPQWLSGSFVSNGPAQFEVGSTHFNHWFDGFAMLKKFDFQEGKVSFQNRFLQSQQYMKSNAANRLHSNEFGTYTQASLWRIRQSIAGLIKGDRYDNCNINTLRVAEHCIAMTESTELTEFKLNDLSTIGSFRFDDNLQGQLTTAHPHLDITTGEIINIAIEIGRVNKYHVYKISPNSTKREIIQSYLSDELFYMHSFCITANYVILFKSPLVINKFKLLFGLPFNNTLALLKKKTSFFIVIDRRDGSVREVETDPFICLHGANAFEKNNELVLDLICHFDKNPYDDLYLANLKSEQPHLPCGTLRRYLLDISSKRCSYTQLSTENQEFPRINYKTMNGKDYQFVYTNLMKNPEAKFLNIIQKMDVKTGSIQRWEKTDYYPGEPVFVAKPYSKAEDEGVVLSIIFNVATQCSSLIILNAMTMQQEAEVSLPLYLPFGLHGNFYIK